jgi:NADH-quinone oxidoreductase subunit N
MLIVFGVAVAGVLVEAFVPRPPVPRAAGPGAGRPRRRFVAVVCVARGLPAQGRIAAMGAVAVDRPALLLQGTILLIGVLGSC